MLRNIMKTEEIEKNILSTINTSVYSDQLRFSLNNIYHFTDKLSAPGTYIFSDNIRYYQISIGDRGKQSEDKIVNDIEKIYFDVYNNLAFNVALKIADKNKKEDYRRELFRCQLEILSTIGKVYEEKGREKIEKILKESPYDDTLY